MNSMNTRLTLVVLSLVASAGCNLAHADVVAVVSAKSPVGALSKNQVADIFLGRSYRFPNGADAVPIDLPEGSALRNEFYSSFTGWTAAQVKAYWSKIIFTGRGQPPATVTGNADLRKALAANPQAIAYVDRSAVDDSMKIVVKP